MRAARGLLRWAIMMRRVLLLLCLGLPGCVTPSVPLPPPDLPALSFASTAKGLVELRGRASARHARVRFAAFNTSRGVGTLVDTQGDGSFTTEPFSGFDGDGIDLSYELAGRRSTSFSCTLTAGQPLNTTICH